MALDITALTGMSPEQHASYCRAIAETAGGKVSLNDYGVVLSVGGMRPTTAHAIHAVLGGVDSQREKWGEQNHAAAKWLQILVEEVGEVAKAMLEGSALDQENEITHVAAVAVSWLDCLNRKADQ